MKPADRSTLLWLAAWALVVTGLVARNFFLGLPDLPVLALGPLSVGPFGVLVLLNVGFGWHVVGRWCREQGLDWETFEDDLLWVILGGLFFSHLASVALYTPSRLSNPIVVIDVREGISSFGGMYGGAALAVWALRRRGLPVWPYVDGLVLAFVGGYMFGRAGCFAVHDHPGVATDFFLAVEIAGVTRHDLGLYEMILMACLFGTLTLLTRETIRPAGFVTAVAATVYAPIRFAFDSLRIDDPRYGGLTPGQWFCLLTLGVAAWAWSVAWRNREGERVRSGR